MVRRFSAVSALIVAGLAMSPAARAQGFLPFYEPSPRDVVDGLYEQGYSVHLPMIRRGDVYVVDAVSASRRPVRLIVSTRDGHVLQRFAASPRWGDDEPHAARWRDEDAGRNLDDSDDPRWERRTRTALGDPADAPPRDGEFEQKLVPPAPLTDDLDKSKRHARKRHDPQDINAKTDPSVAAAPSDPKTASVKATDIPPARPMAAPSGQAKVEDRPAPRVIPLGKTTPAPADDAKSEPAPRQTTATAIPKSEDRPAPRVIPLTKPAADAKVEETSAPKSVETPAKAPVAQANVEEKPAPKAAKPETPHKKLNDLPVGTLD